MSKWARLYLITCFFGYLATSCAHIFHNGMRAKTHPEYKGVDPRVSGLLQEYKWLAKQNGVHFNKEITMGFKNINESSDLGSVIGACHRSSSFREIDVDQGYWETTDSAHKTALVYHELTHCLCEREHDYDDGSYQENNLVNLSDLFTPLKPKPLPGYLEDGCPKSIMAPVILSSSCFSEHYSYYTKEMFERCRAW